MLVRLAVLIMCCCTATTPCKAQFNVHELGKKDVYFGIAMALNIGDFKIYHTKKQPVNDSIRYFRPRFGPGFNLGIICNYQFHRYFDLRFIPALSFSDRVIEYEDIDYNKLRKTISSIYLDFPLQLRFKSEPIRDFRIYVIGGLRYDFDLASNVKSRKADDIIKLNRHDAAAEYGIGVMIYFPYFIMSPEFKVSHGFVNIHAPTPGLIHSRVIERLYSRTFTLTINLEG
ncbi:MAG: PorT family protein [Chitinophagales bacterium]|nr:PorT family protein [Chitinophagales bacterium]MDW8419597.1 porin family protein [Chitinophagales bacterium]